MTDSDSRQHFFSDMTFREADLSEVRRQRSTRILRYALWTAALSAAMFALLFAFTGNTRTAAIEVGVMAVLGALLWALYRGHVATATHGSFLLLTMFVIATNLFEGIGGERQHGFHVWFLALAFGSFLVIPHPRWVSTAYSLSSLAMYALVEMRLLRLEPLMPISRDIFRVANGLAVVFAVAILAGCLVLFRNDIATAEESLNRSNARLEDLLGNMLPASIADRLRKDGRTFADAYAQCTIVFADIVGFSQMAARLPAVELVQTLDSIFSRFDALVENAGLEKIKTIGDAYMVASGIPHARTDHALAAVDLALEMLRVIDDYPGISVRIGINSGPVVAGVIGRKRFIYDLWGDAVNIAQRMEQSGVAGRVQITEATWIAVRHAFETEARGRVAIKGGSDLAAYLVTGRLGESGRAT